jgi:hypothetical protein
MLQRLSLCAVVLSLALLPATAGAQIGRPFKIGFGGGVSVPVSDAKDALETGIHGQVMVMWTAPVLPLSLRGSVGYSRYDLKSLAPGVDGTGSVLSGLANVSWGFPVGPVKPYIIGGLGAFNMKGTVAGVSGPSETKFGIDAGAGLEFKLGRFIGFVEGKVEDIFTEQGLASSQSFDTMVVPVTFGIFF